MNRIIHPTEVSLCLHLSFIATSFYVSKKRLLIIRGPRYMVVYIVMVLVSGEVKWRAIINLERAGRV